MSTLHSFQRCEMPNETFSNEQPSSKMPFGTRQEAALCGNNFQSFLKKTMMPEYSRHSNAVPQSAWQQEFDRLQRWSREVNYWQFPYTDTYTDDQLLFQMYIVLGQKRLFDHIDDKLLTASSFLENSFSGNDERGSQKTEVEKKAENESERAVLQGHFRYIAKKITCLIFTAELTWSQKGLGFSELCEKMTEQYADAHGGALPRDEVRRELFERVELLKEDLTKAEDLKRHISLVMLKLMDVAVELLVIPSTKTHRPDYTHETTQTTVDDPIAGDAQEESPREE